MNKKISMKATVPTTVEGVVYRYINDSDGGKCYVGCTINESKRRSMWNDSGKAYGGMKIAKARNTFGTKAFRYERLAVVSGNDKAVVLAQIEQLERKYIGLFDSFHNGYNSNEGGHGIAESSSRIPVRLIPDNGGKMFVLESMQKAAEFIGLTVGGIHYYLYKAFNKSCRGYKLEIA